MDRKNRGLLVIAVLDLLVMTIGVLKATGTGGHLKFLSLAVAAVAIISFFGYLIMEKTAPGGGTSSDGVLRQAIAVAVVTVYLVLVGVVAFFRGPWTSPEVTRTLMTSFTGIAGTVVAFYFGASAYVEARKPKDKSTGS